MPQMLDAMIQYENALICNDVAVGLKVHLRIMGI